MYDLRRHLTSRVTWTITVTDDVTDSRNREGYDVTVRFMTAQILAGENGYDVTA